MAGFAIPALAKSPDSHAHFETVLSVSISPDGRHVVSGGRGGRIRIWDIASGRFQELREDPGDPIEIVLSVLISPDGRHVISGDSDGRIRIWDIASGRFQELR